MNRQEFNNQLIQKLEALEDDINGWRMHGFVFPHLGRISSQLRKVSKFRKELEKDNEALKACEINFYIESLEDLYLQYCYQWDRIKEESQLEYIKNQRIR